MLYNLVPFTEPCDTPQFNALRSGVLLTQTLDKNAFMNNVECDINDTNSLKHLLNNTEDEYDIIPLSTYTEVNTLAERMSANNSTLSILSLNAQSINAKFDELKITIDQLNEIHTVSVICIQESWLDCNANTDLYRLNNCNLISKGKYVSEHGGLLIYLHVDFEYDIVKDIIGHTTGWEQLFLKIRHKDPNSKNTLLVMYIAYRMKLLVAAIALLTSFRIY